MFSRSVEAARPGALPSGEEVHILPKRRPVPVSLTLLAVLCFTALIASVMTAARAEPAPHLPDIPQAYLPGNLLPVSGWCYWPSNEQVPRCSVEFGDDEVYFSFDALTGIITRSIIPARAYMIGDLIAAWGTPTGIHQKYTLTYVFWETRSALLYTTSFRPESRVEFIIYDLEPSQATSPWHGFRRRNN